MRFILGSLFVVHTHTHAHSKTAPSYVPTFPPLVPVTVFLPSFLLHSQTDRILASGFVVSHRKKTKRNKKQEKKQRNWINTRTWMFPNARAWLILMLTFMYIQLYIWMCTCWTSEIK